MPLLEIADKLNKQHDASTKAQLEKLRQAELLVRKRSFYKENGSKWFEEVGVEIERLISEFNRATGEHSKLGRIVSLPTETNTIEVAFIQAERDKEDSVSQCVLRRHEDDPQVTLALQYSERTIKLDFEVLVKKFSSFEAKVVSVVEKTVLGEGIEWKDRVTGDMNFEPTFHTKTITSRLELNTTAFADYVLSCFTEKMLKNGS